MMPFICPQNPGFPGGGRQATLRTGGESLHEAAAYTLGLWGAAEGSASSIPRAILGPSDRVTAQGSKFEAPPNWV